MAEVRLEVIVGSYLTFIANNDANSLLACYSGNGQTWNPSAQVQDQPSKMASALAAWQGRLWLAFVANNSTDQLLVCSSADGQTWGASTAVANQATKAAPALAYLNV
jgi:hypothetical protein